jgi:hypothetical protein
MTLWRSHRAAALALLVFLADGCTCNRDGAARRSDMEAFYALDEIPTFHITLSPDAIRELEKAPREFVHGSISHQGVTLDDIAVRLKGHRSMRAIGDKPSFKLRFDKYSKKAELLGVRRLTLNNLVEDPTMVREILGYRLLRAMGVPAPDVAYAQVVVNGEPYGLYTLVETLDNRFLKRHFDNASGSLYEGEYGCDLYEDDVEGFDQDSGKDESRADLRALVAAVNGPDDALFDRASSPLDMDAFLAYLAVSAYIGDFDGYRHSHNYRLYHDPGAGKWSFIPWGIDRAFKKSLAIYDSEGLLAKRCFGHAGCRLEYVRMMNKVSDRAESLQLDQGVHVVAAFIDQAVAADTRKPYDRSTMDRARTDLIEYLRKRPAEIRAQLQCLDQSGAEVDRDGDGHACMDCNDADPAVHPGAGEVCDGVDNDCSGLVDDSAACPCQAVDIEGVVFQLCDLPMPWTQAAAFCEGKGARLATIDSAEQSRALYRAASALRNDRWWIGLGDREREGTFVWRDGRGAAAANWSKGEPDNDGCNQDCAALKQGARGKWHDTHCGQHRPFICRQ